jgi:chemotaxis protein MotA
VDIATILGLIISIGSIVGGQALEGGHFSSVLQLTAFVIVMGGTLGACLVQNPMSVVVRAASLASMALSGPRIENKSTIKLILDLANVSRKQGLLALESKLKDIHDPFMRKGVQLIVDGTDPKAVHEILEIEVDQKEDEGLIAAKVWEAAGGYSPTVGILGAVLGLIHVMENLADPSKLGAGIAVAFVATVYGVGAANLLFLPLANKIKFKLREEAGSRTMVIMGLVGLAQGENPRLLQEKLEGYLPHSERTKDGSTGA